MIRMSMPMIGPDEDESGILRAEAVGDHARVVIEMRDREFAGTSTDYFDAFCLARIELWRLQMIPYCYGASLQVYPSGMCRDMGSGLKAYKLTMGRKPERADLVDIFGFGHDIIPASVERQREFYADWVKSLTA